MNRRKLKMKDLKKYILAVVMIIGLFVPCQMNAQVFLDDDDLNSLRSPVNEWNGGLVVPYEGADVDEYTPLGSGLLVMTGIAGTYLLAKRRKDQEK